MMDVPRWVLGVIAVVAILGCVACIVVAVRDRW